MLVQRNTAYSVNDIAHTRFGKKLKCVTAGTTSTDPLIITSSSTINDGTVVWSLQEDGGGQSIVDWQSSTEYSVGDIVINDNKIYKCTTAHTSSSTFDDTKFTELSASESDKGLDMYDTGVSYSVNDVVIYDDKIYRCTTAHTSTSTFDATKWVEISASESVKGLDFYTSGVSYEVNDIVVYDNKIYKCITAHTSTNEFDSTKWIEISASSSGGSGINYWASSTTYAVDDIIVYDNKIYRCTTAHTSTSSFEASNWIEISSSSGSGSSSAMNVLWQGSSGTGNGVEIQLNDSIANYDKIGFSAKTYHEDGRNWYREIDCQSLVAFCGSNSTNRFGLSWGWGSSSDYCDIFSTSTLTKLVMNISGMEVTKIYGIKLVLYETTTSYSFDSNTLFAVSFDKEIKDATYKTIPTNLGVSLPVLDSTEHKYSTTSAYFNGSSGVGIQKIPAFDFGTGDFTVDFWYKQPTSGNIFTNDAATILGQVGGNGSVIFIYNNCLYLGSSSGAFSYQGSFNCRITDGNFHHFAIVRHNSYTSLYIDGDLKESLSDTHSYVWDNGYIGMGNQNLSSSWNGLIGWINGFRVSNVARWTSNFTPPIDFYTF